MQVRVLTPGSVQVGAVVIVQLLQSAVDVAAQLHQAWWASFVLCVQVAVIVTATSGIVNVSTFVVVLTL